MTDDTELSESGLLPDGSQQLDIHGRPITPRRRRRGMNVNIFCAALGTLFAVTYWPGSGLFSMYMQERLGANDLQIGFFSAIVGIGQIAQLIGVSIFERTRTRKVLWVTTVLAYRFLTFAVVGFAIYAHLNGASPQLVWTMLALMAVSFSMAQMSANAWWSWIADLAPQGVRGRFLGNRQLAATLATLLGTLPVILLDAWGKTDGEYTETADYIFIAIFTFCTVSGVIDIIIHAYIPEPARQDRSGVTRLAETARHLANVMRDADFRRFTLAMTLGGFSLMIWSPFVWPYLKSEDYIDIPYWVYFATIGLHCLGMFIGSRYWGILIDRFGSKPIAAINYSAGFLSLYLFFITPENAAWLVCIVGGLLGGLMWSGMMLATAQLMLTLSPQKVRNSYVAVHGSITGTTMLVAPLLGGAVAGWAKGYFAEHHYQLPTGTVFTHMQLLALAGIVLRLAVYPLVLRIREGKEKPMGMVLGTVFAPSQFRTLYSMRLFGGRNVGKRLDAMRRMGRVSDHLAVEDLIEQLQDAEPEVRREAAMALGRIGGPDAVAALVSLLTAPESDMQPEAARALGLAGDLGAVRHLVALLADPNEIIREHAAGALGELQSPESAGALMDLLKKDPSANVFGRGAQALAKLGVMDAIWEVLPRMHQTDNVALRRQLATAVGDLLGRRGGFYHLMNEEFRQPGSRIVRMARRIRSRLLSRAKRIRRSSQLVEAEALETAARRFVEACDEFELQDYARAVASLSTTAADLLRALHGFTGQDELAVEFALSRGGPFGVGLWFLQLARGYAGSRDSRDELMRLDALLGFHFIADLVESLRD